MTFAAILLLLKIIDTFLLSTATLHMVVNFWCAPFSKRRAIAYNSIALAIAVIVAAGKAFL